MIGMENKVVFHLNLKNNFKRVFLEMIKLRILRCGDYAGGL